MQTFASFLSLFWLDSTVFEALNVGIAFERVEREAYTRTENFLQVREYTLPPTKDLTEQKLEQNEDLAKLRADTSIEKSLMSMGSKLASDAAKTKDVEILKGPKR